MDSNYSAQWEFPLTLSITGHVILLLSLRDPSGPLFASRVRSSPTAPSILPLDFLSPTTAFSLLNPWFSSPQFQISERENLFGLTGLMLSHSLLIYSSYMVEPMTQAQMSGCTNVPRWAHLCFHDLSIDGRDVHWCLLGPVGRESPGSTHSSPSGWFTSFRQSTTVRDSAWWK